jgi:hypothetical protein
VLFGMLRMFGAYQSVEPTVFTTLAEAYEALNLTGADFNPITAEI